MLNTRRNPNRGIIIIIIITFVREDLIRLRAGFDGILIVGRGHDERSLSLLQCNDMNK